MSSDTFKIYPTGWMTTDYFKHFTQRGDAFTKAWQIKLAHLNKHAEKKPVIILCDTLGAVIYFA